MKIKKLLRESVQAYHEACTDAYRSLRYEDFIQGYTQGLQTEAVDMAMVRDYSKRARLLVSANPLVIRGTNVRNAYMWSNYVVPEGLTPQEKEFLSIERRCEDETAFCTDGMVVYLVDSITKKAHPIPLHRVGEMARREGALSENDIIAVEVSLLDEPGAVSPQKVWYPVHGEKIKGSIAGSTTPVDNSKCVVFRTVNRQRGSIIGVPNLLGAVSWAKAYKEFLESAHHLAISLARIAFKAKSINGAQQQSIYRGMSSAQGAGGTASLGMGQDLTAVQKAGAGIDFKAGSPLASMVASALDIPLSVLLTDGSAGGRQGAEDALEDPTIKVFNLRRATHVSLVNEVLQAMGSTKTVNLKPITNDLVHRITQSIILAVEKGLLWREEGRSSLLDVLHIVTDKAETDLPPVQSFDNSVGDGRSTGVGPLSDGTNSSRDGDETVA